MGLICSKAKRLPPVLNKNISTPKLPQLKTPIKPDVSKVNTDTKAIASPKQPMEKTTANIASTAAGVALGNLISQKFMKYDNKNYREDVKNVAESSTETNDSNENELENKEITGKDNNNLNEEDKLTDHNHNDMSEEDDD